MWPSKLMIGKLRRRRKKELRKLLAAIILVSSSELLQKHQKKTLVEINKKVTLKLTSSSTL